MFMPRESQNILVYWGVVNIQIDVVHNHTCLAYLVHLSNLHHYRDYSAVSLDSQDFMMWSESWSSVL